MLQKLAHRLGICVAKKLVSYLAFFSNSHRCFLKVKSGKKGYECEFSSPMELAKMIFANRAEFRAETGHCFTHA